MNLRERERERERERRLEKKNVKAWRKKNKQVKKLAM
jgi:hypothetical protein